MMKYTGIPSHSKFQSDSSVTFATRKDDIVLHRIDELLEHREATKDECKRFIFLSDLFFTADYWLKSFRGNSCMEKEREPAVYALFSVCAEELCQFFGCTINGLPRELEFMWGRNLSACGVSVDFVHKRAEYISRAEAAQYKLRFKNGKAYMLPWYRPSDRNQKLEKANSSHAYTPEALTRNGLPANDYGFFVLTMSRDLYMAKHSACGTDGSPGFYHSSYVAGDPVSCSGTMLIVNGVVKRIRLNSGHYQPHMNNLRALIMALRMWGVPLDLVVFEDFNGKPIGDKGTVQEAVEATNQFGALKAGREGTVSDSKEGFRRRPTPDLSQVPNQRDWWGNRPGQANVQAPGLRRM